MSRTMRRERNTYTSHAIRIGGKLVNIDFARVVYRCADPACLGRLKRQDAGLICSQCGGRHFIHRSEAAKIEAERQRQYTEIEAVYEIVDGQIVAKES